MANKPNQNNPIQIFKAATNYLMKRFDNNDIFGAPSIKDISKGARNVGYSKGGLVALGEDSGMEILPIGTSVFSNPKQSAIYEKGDEVNMKLRDYYCTNCDWEAKGTKDFSSIRKCPGCQRHSVMSRKPEQVTDREYYVRDKIMDLNLEHCRSLTPEQVKTVLSIGDEYNSKQVKHTVQPLQPLLHDVLLNEGEEVIPLLSIVLDDINSVPIVYYKGEEITYRMRVSFDFKTNDDLGTYPTYVHIEHWDKEGKLTNTKHIQHNQRIREE